jgi:hypothetical protein
LHSQTNTSSEKCISLHKHIALEAIEFSVHAKYSCGYVGEVSGFPLLLPAEQDANNCYRDPQTKAPTAELSPEENSDEDCSRARLEADVLAIAANGKVVVALQQLLSTSASSSSGDHGTLQQAAKGSRSRLRSAFSRGVRALLSASGDKRLEVSHWTVHRLWSEGDVSELVAWFFREAQCLAQEADEVESRVLAEIFGMEMMDMA